MARSDQPDDNTPLSAERLGEIYDAHYDAIYRYIYHHIGSRGTAQDLAGEVFTRLVEQVEQGRSPSGNVRAWLYRVAHNLYVDELRKRSTATHEELNPALHDDGEPVGQQIQRRLLQEQAREALNALTDKQSAALTLRYLEGLPDADIADMMDITQGAVRVLVHRGLKALRMELVRQGLIDEDAV